MKKIDDKKDDQWNLVKIKFAKRSQIYQTKAEQMASVSESLNLTMLFIFINGLSIRDI